MNNYTVDSRYLDFASRITAYLEVKSRPCFQHGNLIIGKKVMWKRAEIAPKEAMSPLFRNILLYIFNSRSQITYSFVKCGWLIYFSQFCKLDMSRYGYLEYFKESLGIRDNESRL